jgi:hypothetical protein
MIEFRESVLTSLLNLLRSSLENSLSENLKETKVNFKSENEDAKSQSQNLSNMMPLTSIAIFHGKEEVFIHDV